MNINNEQLTTLFKEHAGGLYRYFMLRVGSSKEAEDMVSEAFARLLATGERIADMQETEHVKWLYGIGRNLLKEKYRDLVKELPSMPEDFDLADENISIEDQVADEQLKREAVTALKELPFQQAEVISLKLWEDKTFAEIGELTEQPENTVKSHYYRGLKSLRERFSGTHLGVVLATIVAAKALPELVLSTSALSMVVGSAGVAGAATASTTTAVSTAAVGAGGAIATKGVAIAAAVILAVGSAVGVGIGIAIANNNASAPVSAPVSFPSASDTSGTGDNSAGPQEADEAPLQPQANPYLLIATDKNVIKRSLVDGTETEVLGNLQNCKNGSQGMGLMPASRYNRDILAIWCDRKVYIFTEKGERLDVNLAAYLPVDYEVGRLELSQDKSLLAFSTFDSYPSHRESGLFVYNLKTGNIREYTGNYSEPDPANPLRILPLYFSPDNTKLYTFPAVPAGYLADRILSLNLADGKYTQLKGFDISNAGQIVVSAGNVDATGNIYAWQSETGSAQDSLLKYEITTGKVLDKINLTTKLEAVSPADTTTPFEGIDSKSQLAFFSAYSAACIDESIVGGLVKCDKSKIGLVVFDLANKKILHDLRGKTDHYFGFGSLHQSGDQIYAFKANLNTQRDAISSFTLQSFDLKTGVFKDIKTYSTKMAASILVQEQ